MTTAPGIAVSIPWNGAPAEDVERSILLVLETALRDLDGLVALNGAATDGLGTISAVFEKGMEAAAAERAVRAAVLAIAGLLPGDAGAPRFSAGRTEQP